MAVAANLGFAVTAEQKLAMEGSFCVRSGR
jgi:hypothetical protein